jgi:hypothetical protein
MEVITPFKDFKMARYLIIKSVKPVEEVTTEHKDCDYTNNKDWEFMKHCNEVDEHRPATWIRYPLTIAGANDIIKMEFDELMKNAKDGDMKSWEQNLYHLSVATLNAWRILKHENK